MLRSGFMPRTAGRLVQECGKDLMALPASVSNCPIAAIPRYRAVFNPSASLDSLARGEA